MFLRSLSIRGFKSFADKTVFEFTPGVAVVVGPNGSGKSNLVDAIAWVLGEQGPKTLRGGKMEDVIFAGTPTRPSAGRAEVILTIDNSSGILPIAFSEVTIGRTMFRGGDSEYAINGAQCRLLDVQELLSDTGLGRELHTIVGQGQLDEILSSRPEERRAYIEEAAGILKYRRRRERSVRKLERVDGDIERLGDLIGELRRQIRPLEQQADLAKRAAEIEAELKESTLRLWAVEYRALSSDEDEERERWIAEEAGRLAADHAAALHEAESLESEASDAAVAARDSLSVEYRLASVSERLAGLARLAQERRLHLQDLALRAPAADAPSEQEIAELQRALDRARSEREEAELEAKVAEAELVEVARAREEAARAREELVQLQGERAALRSSVESGVSERQHLQARRDALAAAEAERAAQVDELRAKSAALDAEEADLSARLEEVERHTAQRREEAAEALTRQRELERTIESARARRDALAAEVERGGDGALQLLEHDASRLGLLGRLRDLVEVEPGFERAALAALEPYSGAVLAASLGHAVEAVRVLKDVGGRGAFVAPGHRPAAPEGTRSILDVVRPASAAAEPIRAWLAGVVLAGDLTQAHALASRHPGVVVVTSDGDRVGPDVVLGGSPVAESAPDPVAELRAAEQSLQEHQVLWVEVIRAAEHADAVAERFSMETESLTGALNELDARISGQSAALADLERESEAAAREEAVLSGRAAELAERARIDEERLTGVEARLARAAAAERTTVDVAVLAAGERRGAQRAVRLGALTERERALSESLEAAADRRRRVHEEIQRWESSRGAREAAARRAGEVSEAAAPAGERAAAWAEEARAGRADAESRSLRVGERLSRSRATRRGIEEQLEHARQMAHASDLARAERSHRLAALAQRARDEHRLEPEAALVAAGDVQADEIEGLRRKAATAERRLAMLGRVNPIAMEQHQGLLDRHAFLVEQVNDLRRSRRDLVGVVEEVDRNISEQFSSAFEDVRREFAEVFGRLFPGGEGRLSITDQADLLESGVDIEARPGGKRVKRISLLSGGERALTAIALLVSIFRARPSPFYLLDEVEAALDDVNLHRFLQIVSEFRDTSQMIVVTHQKRTMEVADALYGISMGADGVTKVISERLAADDLEVTSG